MVITSALKHLHVFKCLLLQCHQYTGDDLLPFHSLWFQTVRHHVVNVLYEDNVGVYLVEVLDERTMTARTEQQRTVAVAEWRAVRVSGYGVCGWLLFRERDVVFHTKLVSILLHLVGHLLLEERHMLVANCEMHVCLTLRCCVQCTLYKVFFHWRACSFSIFVEQEHALRQLTVVQSFRLEHVGSHCLVVAFAYECVNVLALIFLAHSVQFVVESKTLYMSKVYLLEVGGRHVIVSIHECKHILEHTACRTACRHELHHLLAFCFVVFPCFNVCFLLICRRSNDALAYRCSSFQTEEWESCLELFKLLFNLLFADTFLSDLF